MVCRGSGHNHFHGLVPMSGASMRRELAHRGVALTIALTAACGGSANLSNVGDATPDGEGQGIAADASTDTGEEPAHDSSVADSNPGADATTGIDASADASSEGGNEDSTAPPPGDATADDANMTSDAAAHDDASMAADEGTSEEDSGEASTDATSGACGTTGLACCPGNQCDATGLWCVSGRCVACGSPGAPCCGTTCNAGNICFAVGSVSQCQACGQPGQPCCTTEPACPGGNTISGRGLCFCTGGGGGPGGPCTSTCSDPGYTCWFNVCVVCGDLGEPCCGSSCSSGLSCSGGSCQ